MRTVLHAAYRVMKARLLLWAAKDDTWVPPRFDHKPTGEDWARMTP